MSTVEDTFSEIVRAETKEPFTVVLLGQTFTVVDQPKVGALLILSRRLDDKSEMVQLAATLRLLGKWIGPAEHARLFDAIENISTANDIQAFMEGDVARFVQAVTNRPT